MSGLELTSLGTAVAACPAAFMAYAVRGRSAAVFGESVYRGPRDEPYLSLTFDDGPSESTPAVLDLLERFHIRATFFMCGRNVRRLPSIAREVRERGHEIGNHSDSHPRFDFKPASFIYRELADAQESIQTSTGTAPKLFRAPFGVRWFGLAEAQRKLGLRGVMWTVIGRDWRLNGREVAGRVTGRASNGAIVCLHDGRQIQPAPDIHATIDALNDLLPRLIHRGFQFRTVSELICLPN